MILPHLCKTSVYPSWERINPVNRGFFGFWYPDAGVFPNEHFIPFKGLYQPYLLSSLQFNLKNNGPVLFFKAIFSHWNCFLLFFATDGKDGHGLKLEKIGPTFSLSVNTMLAYIIKKILYWLLLPDGICLIIISSSNNSIRSFAMSKGTTLAENWH